jgi:putative NADH-flavin reductase
LKSNSPASARKSGASLPEWRPRPRPRHRPAFGLLLFLLAATVLRADGLDNPLEILVFGASGDVGSRLVNEALRRNEHVSAVTRDRSRIAGGRHNLQVVEGDLLDPASVAQLLPGKDVVLLAVRGAAEGSSDPARTIHLLGIRQLVEALRGMPGKRPRLLIVGGAGSLEVKPGVTYADSVPRIFYFFVSRELKQEVAGHRLALEYLATVDDVDWTYVSPPKKLEQGLRTGEYQLGGEQMIFDAKGKSRITIPDFAVAILDLAESGGHEHEHLSVVRR